MLDLAGGSGTFSIPLALDYPQMRIVLADLPESLRDVRQMLATHGLDQQIQLRGIDALHAPWRLPENDGIFIGNFLHAFDDTVCINVLKEAHCRLSLGGKIWVHEMLWYENRDGPLITALWHAAMRSAGPGRQRTGSELSRLLAAAGFSDMRVIPTSGAYAMVVGRKNPR
jgi:acetylserotonin N-methyltransferase